MFSGNAVAQTILVALGASLVSCAPLASDGPATAIVSSNSIANIANTTAMATFNGTHPGDVITTAGNRAEIGTDLCHSGYQFLYDLTIMQVPEAWWKHDKRWQGDAEAACAAWIDAIESSGPWCGFRPKECWEIVKKYPSGKPGWLHARFTTCILSTTERFLLGYRIFDRTSEYHDISCDNGL